MGKGGAVQDWLLIRTWVPHPEGFVRDYCEKKKKNVAFRTDLAVPTEIMDNGVILLKGKCFRQPNYCFFCKVLLIWK